MNIRDMILSADDYQYEELDIPEWGCKITVRSMSADEKDKFEESLIKETKKRKKNKIVTERKHQFVGVRAKLAQLSVCKGKGEPELIFSDSDIIALGAKNSKPLDRIYEVATRLSAIGEDDIEELTGN